MRGKTPISILYGENSFIESTAGEVIAQQNSLVDFQVSTIRLSLFSIKKIIFILFRLSLELAIIYILIKLIHLIVL